MSIVTDLIGARVIIGNPPDERPKMKDAKGTIRGVVSSKEGDANFIFIVSFDEGFIWVEDVSRFKLI